MRCFVLLTLALAALRAAAVESTDDQRAHALILLKGLASAFAPSALEGAIPSHVRLVTQKPGQLWENDLPPVWTADLETPDGIRGHLMWDNGAAGKLLEFALDAPLTPHPSTGGIVQQIRGIQQFPVSGKDGRMVASGCVPTAAGILIQFWSETRFSNWAGETVKDSTEGVQSITRRIRKRLRMAEIPDNAGYTDDGMHLSGAFPKDLKDAIAEDAAEHGVLVQTEYRRFSMERLREEISEGRPVLLDCMVRLPHKPQLSWGHEITGVGWLEWEGIRFAGVRDNFFPTGSDEATRWIREESFGGMLTVRPSQER